MNFYTEPLDDLLKHFGVDPQKGLNQAQLEQAREKYGKNVLREQKKPSLLMRFLAQFKDTMIIILIIAAIISFFVAAQSGETREFLEPALILAIVILNAIMGMMQESKAEKAMEALKSMSAPHARVVRNGREAVIDASDLVPGDVILVEAGDFVPADARLIESASLKSEESALTGESVPVEKDAQAAVAEDAPLGDRVQHALFRLLRDLRARPRHRHRHGHGHGDGPHRRAAGKRGRHADAAAAQAGAHGQAVWASSPSPPAR